MINQPMDKERDGCCNSYRKLTVHLVSQPCLSSSEVHAYPKCAASKRLVHNLAKGKQMSHTVG